MLLCTQGWASDTNELLLLIFLFMSWIQILQKCLLDAGTASLTEEFGVGFPFTFADLLK